LKLGRGRDDEEIFLETLSLAGVLLLGEACLLAFSLEGMMH